MDRFPDDVVQKLGWYVYRLLDPRNGETFYVGKGRGNQLFDHVRGAQASTVDEDAADLKLQRIKDINAAGLEVLHIVHRHQIETAEIAYQIEAAVMDAYPGIANRAGGHGSGDYGCQHAKQIMAVYAAAPFVAVEPLILISIAKSYEDADKDIYDAVRGVWRISKTRAQAMRLVLAHVRGVIVGAYRPDRWVPATREHFPWLEEPMPARIGFDGQPADPATWAHYVGKRVPDRYRERGAANPVRFIDPEPREG